MSCRALYYAKLRVYTTRSRYTYTCNLSEALTICFHKNPGALNHSLDDRSLIVIKSYRILRYLAYHISIFIYKPKLYCSTANINSQIDCISHILHLQVGSLYYSSLYLIPIKNSPLAGKVVPRCPLSFLSMIVGISKGAIFPSPTFTSVPAIILTIL